MTAIALLLIVLGTAVALTRAPLMVAPRQTRDFYMRLFNTDERMRFMGLFVVALGAIAMWSAWGVGGPTAQVVFGFGVFLVTLAALSMIPFPGAMRRLATKIWLSFGDGVMRVMGGLAVGLGLALIYVGFGL